MLNASPKTWCKQAEAADLRAELQSWTQNLTELRNVIDSLDDGDDSAPAASTGTRSPAKSAQHRDPSSKSTKVPEEGSSGDALQLLKDLTQLSEQILSDAHEDAQIFAEAAAARGLNSGMQDQSG